MLVTFSCEVHGDITFLGDTALLLLKIMGHSGTVSGAISAEDVPEAMRRLSDAVDVLPADNLVANRQDEKPVTLKNRAFPLLRLLATAAKAQVYVMWK